MLAKAAQLETARLTGLSWPAESSQDKNFSRRFLCLNLESWPVIWSDWICYGKYSSHPTVRWSCEHQRRCLASVSLLVIFQAVQINSSTHINRLLLYSSYSNQHNNSPAIQKIHPIHILYICPPVLKRGTAALIPNSIEDVTAANFTLHIIFFSVLKIISHLLLSSTYLLSVSALHLGERSSKDLVNFTT